MTTPNPVPEHVSLIVANQAARARMRQRFPTRRAYYIHFLAEEIAAHPELRGEALRRHLLAAFPHPPRKYSPYKVYLEEVAEATGAAKLRRAGTQDRLLEKGGTLYRPPVAGLGISGIITDDPEAP